MAFGLSAGAVAAIGMVGGGLIAANASRSAAGTAAGASDRAAQINVDQYAQTRADQAPYRDAGYTSLAQLTKGTAAGGEFNKPFSMNDYLADPGYQFRVQQGEEAINRAAIAGGGRYSGATLKALTEYGSGQASQEFGNAYNRYQSDLSGRYNRIASVAGIGQTATNQTQAAGQASATGQATAVQNAGNARASGYTGTANAINGTIGTLANGYMQNQYLSGMNDSSYGAGGGRAYDYSSNMQQYGI